MRGILTQADQAKVAAQHAARGETGRLRAGFSGSAAFNPAVPAPIRNFRRAFPAIDLSLMEANTQQLVGLLRKGEIDAAFIRPAIADPEELAGESALPFSALAAEPFILYPQTVGLGLHEEVVAHCRRAGFEPRRAIGHEPELAQESPQMASAINLVAAERGVSIVPRSLAQITVPGVRFVPFVGEGPAARLACAVRRGERGVAARNFMTLAKNTKAAG